MEKTGFRRANGSGAGIGVQVLGAVPQGGRLQGPLLSPNQLQSWAPSPSAPCGEDASEAGASPPHAPPEAPLGLASRCRDPSPSASAATRQVEIRASLLFVMLSSSAALSSLEPCHQLAQAPRRPLQGPPSGPATYRGVYQKGPGGNRWSALLG